MTDDSVRREFHNKISRLSKSAAYLDYCEELTGYKLCQFNMMDRQQLEYLFEPIPLSAEDRLLDLGCGSGGLLRALTEGKGCCGVGIDRLPPSAVGELGGRTQYICGDIDDIGRYKLKPTVTLAIDSLYFSRDPETLLRYLCGVEGNRLYIFFSQYLFDGSPADMDMLRPERTRIALGLSSAGVRYTTLDYGENERLLYERSICALRARRENFKREGNQDLYEQKLEEQLLGKRLYDSGRAGRWLYIVD